jgi:prepilin-type N-terminal cleavage/methylation domain-containing protein
MKIKSWRSAIFSEKGFSLIETIVIIVIIGILAAIAMVHYNNLSNSGKIAACRSNQFAIETAQKIFYIQNLEGDVSHFASSLDELKSHFQNNEIPVCPLGGTYELLPWGGTRCSIDEHN